MKKLILFACAALLFSCKEQPEENNTETTSSNSLEIRDTSSVNDEATIEQSSDPSDPVAFIRQKVERINTIELKKEHYEFICDVKMMVDVFRDEDEIVKIAVDYGFLGDYYAKEGYYYNNGKLIFTYEYVEGGPACEGCYEKHEYRAYIKDDKTFRYLKDKDATDCKTCTFSQSSKQYELLRAKNEQEIKAILCPQ